MSEIIGRAALMVVTDKKTLQKVLTGILIVFIALFTPVIAAVEVLNSDFTIDADELETMLMSHLDESEKAQLQEMDSQIRKLDNKMSSAGYGARTKEAEVLWMLALYGKPTDSKTADKLVKCFREDQTDNQLVAAVNKTFGTNVAADIFTISTIQVLCTQRPDEAADITGKFGKYLRQNLESLGQTGMIPFGKELEHTRLYTDIEMVRFESITVEYEIGDRNFEIPSLTLQPMVENAIRHGVRGCEKGIVRVVTRLKDGYHEIIIQDNGCGFDPEKIKEDKAPHIGIRNVRERLQSMCGGTLTIDSIIGEGTTVTLAIPTENIENNQKHHQ